MRHEIYRMERHEAIALLESASVFHVATTRPDGMPVLRTLNGVVVDDAFVFHGAPVGEKVEAIGRSAVVSVEEVVTTLPSYFLDPRRAGAATAYFRSVQAHGVIAAVTDPAEKARLLEALMRKYQPEGGYEPLDADHPMYRGAIAGLLVCRIPFERLDGKAKLGQNRRPEELGIILNQLWRRGLPSDPATIELLRATHPELPTPAFLEGPAGARLCCAMAPADAEAVADMLAEVYWNAGLTREQVRQAQLGSDVWVGAKDGAGRVIATARALSDGAKNARVYDVMVAPEWRGRGLGKAVFRLILDHPKVRHAAFVRLATRDAQGLYAGFGFVEATQLPPKPYPSSEMVLRRQAVPARPTPAE